MKKTLSAVLALLLLSPAFCACAPTREEAKPLVLAQNGESAYRIVLAEDAEKEMEKVADELQSYFRRATRIPLPICTDAEEESEYEILIGKTNRNEGEEIDRAALGDEGFLIRNLDQKILITGNTVRGTLYGVYEFLETYAGCRFFSTQNFFPELLDEVVIEPFEDNVQKPAFSWRRHSHDFSTGLTMRTNCSWSGDASDYIGGEWSYANKQVCHTFGPLLGWTSAQSYHKQPCLTDEAVYEKMLAGALEWMEKDPTAEIISISQNDAAIQDTGECNCENCVASNEKYGASGTMLNFVNRIAAELKKEYPHVMVETLAYIHTEEVPKGGVVPADNVIIRFCTMGGCHMHSLVSEERNTEAIYPSGTNAHYENLLAWSEIAETIYVWDYDINFGSVLTFVPNFKRLYENVHFFYEIGVDGVFLQGYGETGEFDHLRAYLCGKLLWNPGMSYEEYEAEMMDFLNFYYGNGAEDMKAVIDYVTELVGHLHPSMYHDLTRFYPHVKNEDGTADKTHCNNILSHFDSALEKVRTLGEKKRIERTMVSFLYYESTLTAMDVANKKAELSELVSINERMYEIMQRESLTARREGSSIPSSPNLKNTLLYWAQGGEGIFNPTTEQAYLKSLQADA